MAREAGFANLNVDLMSGLPGSDSLGEESGGDRRNGTRHISA